MLICSRPSSNTIFARVATRTPITVWHVLASVTAIKTKTGPRSFDSFLKAELIPSKARFLLWLESHSKASGCISYVRLYFIKSRSGSTLDFVLTLFQAKVVGLESRFVASGHAYRFSMLLSLLPDLGHVAWCNGIKRGRLPQGDHARPINSTVQLDFANQYSCGQK